MKKVAVVGVGQTRYRTRRDDVTHPELTYEAATAALESCGLSIEDIDAVVYGTMDPFDGINCPDKWCAGGAGAFGKPYMKISTGGTTGLTLGIAAYQHVASGMFDLVLAIGTQRVGSGINAQMILNTCACPVYERDAGAGAITIGAMQAARHMARFGSTNEQRALISVSDHRNAMNNPYAHIKMPVTVDDVLSSQIVEWPLRLLECCPRSDGACAIVMASEDVADDICERPAWIMGVTSISDSYFWGDRPDLGYWDSLAIAGRELYRQSGITEPLSEIDVVELYAPFTSQILLELEALGFCAPGEAGDMVQSGATSMGGALPINPSGGVLCSNPIGITGLVRLGEASLQVMGTAGARQVEGAEVALAHAWGGTAQFHALMLVGSVT